MANFKLAERIHEFEDCDKENFQEWFKCDVGGHHLSTDIEIFVTLMEDPNPSEDYNTKKDFSDEEHVEKRTIYREGFSVPRHSLEVSGATRRM